MQKTDQQQNKHAAVEDTESVGASFHRIGDDDRETDSEQQREYRIEFAVDENVLQIMHDTVDSGRRHGIRRFDRKEGV